MKTWSYRFLLAVAVLATSTLPAKAADPRWTMVRTPSLTVIGDQPPKTLRDVAIQIEQFRTVLAGLIRKSGRSLFPQSSSSSATGSRFSRSCRSSTASRSQSAVHLRTAEGIVTAVAQKMDDVELTQYINDKDFSFECGA